MITINLLPSEMRKVRADAFRVPYLPFLALGGVLFLLMTLFFYADYLKARSSYGKVHEEWARLNPLMAQLKALENSVGTVMRGEKEFLEQYVLNTDPRTALMMSVSENLPPRTWLTELRAEREGAGNRLTLQGVALSGRDQSGIAQVEAFLQSLKKSFPQANLTLTTSRENESDRGGTAFKAVFEAGITKKS